MKFDLMKAISMANSLKNPKEAIGMALNMLAKKNPQMAGTISKMIKSGDDPVKAIEKFSKEGSIKSDDLKKMKSIYGMAKKAGFKKFDVPKETWDKAEKALSATSKVSDKPINYDKDWF